MIKKAILIMICFIILFSCGRKGDPEYQNMSPNFDKSISFKAACELIFHGKSQPSGYTEPLLHLNRLIKKS